MSDTQPINWWGELWTFLKKIFAPSASRAFGFGDSAEVYAVSF